MALSLNQKAPSFYGTDQHGKEVSLEKLKGKKIILYFYPKDNTPTCTTEACNLRDNYDLLQQQGYVIIGVSADTEKSHLKFSEKYELPFSLLSDLDLKIIKAYDAWGEKMLYGRKYMGILRKTFIINKKGMIEEIIEKVESKNHTQQILGENKSPKK
ncbi:thioredoxin-dependent thiol peroxidase [soil metagenome]